MRCAIEADFSRQCPSGPGQDRLGAPDHSLNATVRQDSDGELQDWLVDETPSQEAVYADREELSGRSALLQTSASALIARSPTGWP